MKLLKITQWKDLQEAPNSRHHLVHPRDFKNRKNDITVSQFIGRLRDGLPVVQEVQCSQNPACPWDREDRVLLVDLEHPGVQVGLDSHLDPRKKLDKKNALISFLCIGCMNGGPSLTRGPSQPVGPR